MKYGYYPGCSLKGISNEYDLSIRNLFQRLNVEMDELPQWLCCGTLAAPSTSRLLGLATPLWNMAQAARAGYEQIISPCSACLYHFKAAQHKLQLEPELRSEVEAVIGLPLNGQPTVVHPLQVLSASEFEIAIRRNVVKDLSDLKAVCYYGCHISRPAPVMQFDDPENPQSMDRLLRWAGIQAVNWSGKMDCCGANFSIVKPEVVIGLGKRIFDAAQAAGAEAIIVACPMCHANLDTREKEIEARFNVHYGMPVLYFSQVLGLAMGIPESGLGFHKHLVDPRPMLNRKCLEGFLPPRHQDAQH